MKQIKISKVLTHFFRQGFLGQGHKASAIVDGNNFQNSDPFIILMDDRLDLPGHETVGGPHPHAGFETVTLVLKGNEKEWKTGTFEIMTAGKGIIHTEEITDKTEMHILQLWLVLRPEQRWAEPFLQTIHLEDVPTLKTDHSEIRIYSGSSNGLTSPIQNQTPLHVVDFHLQPNAQVSHELPPSFNGFIYVLGGEVHMGESTSRDISELQFHAGEQGSRFVLYAGVPQKAPIVSYGPFIGDTQADIARLYKEYRDGGMPHLSQLPSNKKVIYHSSDKVEQSH
jgi:redox-sensitive bicupin YhaK (pirin superfamily)